MSLDQPNPEQSADQSSQEEPVKLASQQEVDARVKLVAKSMAADPELREMRERMSPMPYSLRMGLVSRPGSNKQ